MKVKEYIYDYLGGIKSDGEIRIRDKFENLRDYLKYKEQVNQVIEFLTGIYGDSALVTDLQENIIENDSLYNIVIAILPAHHQGLEANRRSRLKGHKSTLSEISVLTHGAFVWEEFKEMDTGLDTLAVYFEPELVELALNNIRDIMEQESKYDDMNGEKEEADYSLN